MLKHDLIPQHRCLQSSTESVPVDLQESDVKLGTGDPTYVGTAGVLGGLSKTGSYYGIALAVIFENVRTVACSCWLLVSTTLSRRQSAVGIIVPLRFDCQHC